MKEIGNTQLLLLIKQLPKYIYTQTVNNINFTAKVKVII